MSIVLFLLEMYLHVLSHFYYTDIYCLISITQKSIVLFLLHICLLSYFYYIDIDCLISITHMSIVLFILDRCLLSYFYYADIYYTRTQTKTHVISLQRKSTL